MKRVLVIAACLALTLAVGGAQDRPDQNTPARKKPAPRSAPVPQRGGAPALGIGVGRTQQQRSFEPTMRGLGQRNFREPIPRMSRAPSRMTTGNPANAATTRPTFNTRTPTTQTFTPRHFNLPKKSNQAVGMKFQGTGHIQGSENWKGKEFEAFRKFHHEWHDADWWRRHHDRIVIVVINNVNSAFFFDTGFWFPAWGYYPYSIYPYDGPIYGYNDLPPDQVIANVQAALQEQGYYDGEIDGVLGPLTRAAIARYQQDHGLYVTSAIDEPTLASLGMV